MTSGTTKKEYTREETMQMLHLYLKKASDEFQQAQKKVTEKLTKLNIPLHEFTEYSVQQEGK